MIPFKNEPMFGLLVNEEQGLHIQRAAGSGPKMPEGIVEENGRKTSDLRRYGPHQ